MMLCAAEDSHFNMVQHAWAIMNLWLVGKCLSETMLGESIAPDTQSNLTEIECKDKEKIVLENAIGDVKKMPLT